MAYRNPSSKTAPSHIIDLTDSMEVGEEVCTGIRKDNLREVRNFRSALSAYGSPDFEFSTTTKKGDGFLWVINLGRK